MNSTRTGRPPRDNVRGSVFDAPTQITLPRGLHPEVRVYATDLFESHTHLEQADLPAVLRLAELVRERKAMRAQVDAEGMLVPSPQGTKAHPLLSAGQRHEALIQAAERGLRIAGDGRRSVRKGEGKHKQVRVQGSRDRTPAKVANSGATVARIRPAADPLDSLPAKAREILGR